MSDFSVSMKDMAPLIREMLAGNGTATFTVTGWSMQPMLYDRRDTVTIVNANDNIRVNDVIFYCRDDGSYILHRILKRHKDGTFTCRGDNQWQKEFPVRPDQVIGVLSSFIRNGRQYSVDHWKYKLYVFTWPFFHHFKWMYKYYSKLKSAVKGI